jgi:tetratricopeptide (TPR) repeat protein
VVTARPVVLLSTTMRLGAHRWFAFLAMILAVHSAVLTAAFPAFAQGSKGQQDLIAKGRSLFDDQQYEESIQTLSGALVRPSNTTPQKLEIYRLLALNYITLGRKDEAESAVRGLLALQPAYALPASESPKFRDFFAAVRQKWEAEGRPGLVRDTPAGAAAVTMTHTSPADAEAHKQLDLTATLNDPNHKVTQVKVFFRHGSSGDFEEAEGTIDGDQARVSIPPASVIPNTLEYYLSGFDAGGTAIVSRGDAEAPMRVAVAGGAKGWLLPVAIGGGAAVVALAVLIGVLASGKSSSPGNKAGPLTTAVTINVQ